MKSKNFTSLILLTLVVVLPMLSGCFKKGSEDPFFSMYTRKARITGLWTVNYANSDLKTIYGEGTTQIRTVTNVNGTTWKETIYLLGTDSVAETKGKIVLDNATKPKYTYYFDENGIMNSIYEYEVIKHAVNEDMGTDTTITTTIRHEFSGTWNFLGGIDDYLNKERLALVIQEEKYLKIVTKYTVSEDSESAGVSNTTREARTVRYANGEMSTIWVIRMLKNKQIILDQNVNDLEVYTDVTQTGTSVSVVGTRTQTLVRD